MFSKKKWKQNKGKKWPKRDNDRRRSHWESRTCINGQNHKSSIQEGKVESQHQILKVSTQVSAQSVQHTSPLVNIKLINNVKQFALVDSGATVSIIDKSVLPANVVIKKSTSILKAAGEDNKIKTLGQVNLNFYLGNKVF